MERFFVFAGSFGVAAGQLQNMGQADAGGQVGRAIVQHSRKAERGGGEMTFEAANLAFAAPAAILVPPTTAHGFRFHPEVTDGWVVSFTEYVAEALGERSGEALRLHGRV